jgi:acetylornithine deacetylase/succinyl-diaminopimelate desuccinylase-like protein
MIDASDAIRQSRADLERLVRIPSVSADPDAGPHVWASAGEVAALLCAPSLTASRSA